MSSPTKNEFNDVDGEELLKSTENHDDLALKHSATEIASGTTQESITVTEEIKQAASSSFNISSQLTSNNEIISSDTGI